MSAIPQTVPPDPVEARPIRVMIVDDSIVIRRILSNWLGELPDVQIVAAHVNGRKAVEDIRTSQPDIVISTSRCPTWTD